MNVITSISDSIPGTSGVLQSANLSWSCQPKWRIGFGLWLGVGKSLASIACVCVVHSVFSIYIPISLTGLVLPFASPMPPWFLTSIRRVCTLGCSKASGVEAGG